MVISKDKNMNKIKLFVKNMFIELEVYNDEEKYKYEDEYLSVGELIDNSTKLCVENTYYFEVNIGNYILYVYEDRMDINIDVTFEYSREVNNDLYFLLSNPFIIHYDDNGVNFMYNNTKIAFSVDHFATNIGNRYEGYCIDLHDFYEDRYILYFFDYYNVCILRYNTVKAIGKSSDFHNIFKSYLNSDELHEFIDHVYESSNDVILLPCHQLDSFKAYHDEFEVFKKNRFPNSALGFMSFLYSYDKYDMHGTFINFTDYLVVLEEDYNIDMSELYNLYDMRKNKEKDHFNAFLCFMEL